MTERRTPFALDQRTAFRLLEIRAGRFAIDALNTYSRTALRPSPTSEQMARAVLEAADQVRAGTWVDPDPPRRLTDDQVQAWIDEARVRVWTMRKGRLIPEHHELMTLIVDAEIMLRGGMVRRRASAVESDIIAEMKARGVEPV